jgi:hypothetical protein
MRRNTMPTVQELIDYRQLHYKPDDPVAYSLWTANDVRDVSEDYDLSDQEVRGVLDWASNKEDAEVGINWEVIRFYVDEVIRERNQDA